jgi:phage N-6-adenine-methyltransferase
VIALQPNLFSMSLVVTEEDKDNDENYTPDRIVKPFRDLIGGFHLDAFSCARANEIIQAKRYFTKADDAFSQDLTEFYNKWFNPPYSKGNIDRAVEMVLSYAHIGNSFLLVNSNTSSNWFIDAQRYCVCQLTFDQRIEFTNPKNDGTKKDSGNTKGQTLFYFGVDYTPKQIKACCGHLGNVSVTI